MHFCERLLKLAAKSFSLDIIIESFDQNQWLHILKENSRKYNHSYDEKCMLLVLDPKNNRIIGGSRELEQEFIDKYNLKCDLSLEQLEIICKETDYNSKY